MNTNTNATGVKCWKCGKIIKTGQRCIEDSTTLGVWCSIGCWALDKGNFVETKLTDKNIKEMQEENEIYKQDFYEFV